MLIGGEVGISKNNLLTPDENRFLCISVCPLIQAVIICSYELLFWFCSAIYISTLKKQIFRSFYTLMSFREVPDGVAATMENGERYR